MAWRLLWREESLMIGSICYLAAEISCEDSNIVFAKDLSLFFLYIPYLETGGKTGALAFCSLRLATVFLSLLSHVSHVFRAIPPSSSPP